MLGCLYFVRLENPSKGFCAVRRSGVYVTNKIHLHVNWCKGSYLKVHTGLSLKIAFGDKRYHYRSWLFLTNEVKDPFIDKKRQAMGLQLPQDKVVLIIAEARI